MKQKMIEYLERIWQQTDEGIWETRGGRRHFTHSKVMAWVALDRAITAAERFDLEAPLGRWKGVRAAIHDRVCRDGLDASLNSFVQSFGSDRLVEDLQLMS